MSHSELRLDLDKHFFSFNNGCRCCIPCSIHCFLCTTSINSRFSYYQNLFVSF